MRPLLLAAALVAVAAAGCAGIGSKGSAREGGTIRVGVSRTLDSLDPGIAQGDASREVLSLVYTPPLVYARAGQQLKLLPGVAAAVPKPSADGTSYAIALRRGVRYSDGRPVRAADVGFAIRRSRALSARARRLFAGLRGIASDDRAGRVSFRLRRPDPDFPHLLATTYAAPLPASTPRRDTTGRPPPGVGPYAIVASVPHRRFVLRRNPAFELPSSPKGYMTGISARYGGGTPAVDDGSLDYVQARPPTRLLPAVRSEEDDRYTQHVALSTLYLRLDAARPPFDEPDVRQAAELALDKRKLAVLANGFLEPTCNLLPPAVVGYRRLNPCPWGDPQGEPDLVKARALVERAGAAGARVAVAPAPSMRRPAREVVATLRKLGLRARLGGRRPQARLALLRAPLPTASQLLGPLAESPRAEPGLARLARELAREPDAGRAMNLAAELDRELVKRAAAVPIGYEERPALLSARMDAENCERFNPVYGNDWASFCLR